MKQILKLQKLNIKNYWRNFIKKADRYKIHFAIVLTMAVYILLTPAFYANHFIKYGKPIKLNEQLPFTSDDILFTIDSNESIIIDGQQFQQIIGWAILVNELDQSKYEKYVVLNSETRTYLFKPETMERPDIQNKYKNQKIDVLSSGFRALISFDNLNPGTYNIGLMFREPTDNKVYYSVSNQYLIRTPNHVSMKM